MQNILKERICYFVFVDFHVKSESLENSLK